MIPFAAERTRSAATADVPRIAVLVPCHDEEATVARVVEDFRRVLPQATVYVYDNASSDATAERARAAGAVVRREPLRGKGHVVRRMFADVEADVYVLVDGDATYDATAAPAAIRRLLAEGLDLVNIARRPVDESAFRAGHRLGNRLLTGTVALLFGNRFRDMLSGYKVFSRRFVKSFPALSRGFEIETELTVHALELAMPVAEIEAPYRERPPGSVSKLHTFRDGLRILWTIFILLKETRPAQLFFTVGTLLLLLAVVLAIPLVETYLETGLVPRLPTAVLCTGLVILGMLSGTCGLILDSVARGRKEAKRLWYASLPAPVRLPEAETGR